MLGRRCAQSLPNLESAKEICAPRLRTSVLVSMLVLTMTNAIVPARTSTLIGLPSPATAQERARLYAEMQAARRHMSEVAASSYSSPSQQVRESLVAQARMHRAQRRWFSAVGLGDYAF